LLIIALLDQIIKSIIVSKVVNPIEVFSSFSIVNVKNPGAAFSSFTNSTLLLTFLAIVVFIGIVTANFLKSLPIYWAIISGGILGNLVDRIFRGPKAFQGHVVDFISIAWWPAFNIADSAIVIGAAIVVYSSFRNEKNEPNKSNTSI
jgi:signal peptidase II